MKLIVNDTAGNVLHKAENSMCYPDKRQTHLWLHDGAELRHLIQWVYNVTDKEMTITVGERDLHEEAARRRAFDRMRELAHGVTVGGHQTFSQQTPTAPEDGKA